MKVDTESLSASESDTERTIDLGVDTESDSCREFVIFSTGTSDSLTVIDNESDVERTIDLVVTMESDSGRESERGYDFAMFVASESDSGRESVNVL